MTTERGPIEEAIKAAERKLASAEAGYGCNCEEKRRPLSDETVTARVARSTESLPERRDRLSWLSELGDRIDSYAGKWVAIGDRGLVAVEDSAREALDKARAAGEERPLIHHIPEKGQAGGFGL